MKNKLVKWLYLVSTQLGGRNQIHYYNNSYLGNHGNQAKRSEASKHMLDSLTSDLAVSMTSEDLRSSEEAEKLLKPTTLNLASLTHIDDDIVTFVDEE